MFWIEIWLFSSTMSSETIIETLYAFLNSWWVRSTIGSALTKFPREYIHKVRLLLIHSIGCEQWEWLPIIISTPKSLSNWDTSSCWVEISYVNSFPQCIIAIKTSQFSLVWVTSFVNKSLYACVIFRSLGRLNKATLAWFSSLTIWFVAYV